jgi:hypothetical protein
MVNNSVVLPVAILSAVAAAMLVFIWWWFPRAWDRGTAQDRADIDAELRRREAVRRANIDAESGEDNAPEAPDANKAPPQPRAYVAPVTPY